MSNCKYDFGVFHNECEATNIVGVVELFKDKEDFLKACYANYADIIKDKTFTVDDVKEGQIRYLPRGMDGNGSGYYLVSGRMKGSSDVYYIDL